MVGDYVVLKSYAQQNKSLPLYNDELWRVTKIFSNALLITRVVDKLVTVRHFSQVKRIFRENDNCVIPSDLTKMAKLAVYVNGAPDLPNIYNLPKNDIDGPAKGTRSKVQKELNTFYNN